MPEKEELLCDVCNKPAVGVCNALGPCSCAFCKECLQLRRYPWWNMVGYLCTVSPEEAHPSVHELIKPTLEFYGKTAEEFWAECKKAWENYCKAMQVEQEAADGKEEEASNFLQDSSD